MVKSLNLLMRHLDAREGFWRRTSGRPRRKPRATPVVVGRSAPSLLRSVCERQNGWFDGSTFRLVPKRAARHTGSVSSAQDEDCARPPVGDRESRPVETTPRSGGCLLAGLLRRRPTLPPSAGAATSGISPMPGPHRRGGGARPGSWCRSARSRGSRRSRRPACRRETSA
jgi:hypothetical protein